MLALFPRLADFSIPERRHPEELWQGDAELLQGWARGELGQAIVRVARARSGQVAGVVLAQPRPEALSGRPAAHVEALAVAPEFEGRGLGRALMAAVESESRSRGLTALTLNVFTANQRARGLYRKLGFDEELLRCIKDL